MSLAEFPLNLILIRNVEVGLDRDDGLGNFFVVGGSFVLDVHDGRSMDVRAVGEGRADELRGIAFGSLEVYISKHRPGKQFMPRTHGRCHHQKIGSGNIGKADPRMD